MLILVFLTTDFTDNKTAIRTYYYVYLDGEVIGKIESDQEFLKYIDDKQKSIKEQYSVSNVNVPVNLMIEKVMTYQDKVDKISDVYNIIEEKSSFTIEGYQINISGLEDSNTVYVTDMSIFDEAIENVMKTFIGTDVYNNYKNGTQKEIEVTGTYIKDVYVENNITTKKMNIPVREKIYTSVEDLTNYLLYGKEGYSKKYVSAIGDTIDKIAFENKISIEEFIMSNPSFRSSSYLLYPGQELTIGVLDPQIQISVEQEIVDDSTIQYNIVESVDETKLVGDDTIVQEGENGIIRVHQYEKVTNGISVNVETQDKQLIKPAVDKIIIKGGKKVSGVGSLEDWAWPTISGWRISSKFSYRINPVTFKREVHNAIDIAGVGYGSEVYAANNGVIDTISYNDISGNYIFINHNNGYYTQYNHLSKIANIQKGQAVEKGQGIGYVGDSGQTTGPHLHFGVWIGRPWSGTAIDPLTLYK